MCRGNRFLCLQCTQEVRFPVSVVALRSVTLLGWINRCGEGPREAEGKGGNMDSYQQEKPGETVKQLSLSQLCSSVSAVRRKLPIGSGEWNFFSV